jgi:hypothetical protein
MKAGYPVSDTMKLPAILQIGIVSLKHDFMMKKFLLILLAVFTLISCSKEFLDENTKGLMLPPDSFRTKEELEKWVNGTYGLLNLMFNDPREFMFYLGGDDVTADPGTDPPNYIVFDVFSPGINWVSYNSIRMWAACYKTIKQTNTIILNVNESDINQKIPEIYKKRALGQAYFVRALTYYFLARIWGEVPLITDLDVSYSLKKSSFKEIFDLIISDLKKAEILLPETWKNDPGATELEKTTYYARPSAGSAKALLASVYLTMAGYPLKETSNYALAAAKAKEVIDKKTIYGYNLMTDYADLWLNANNLNSETVFGCFYNHLYENWKDDPDGSLASLNMVCPLVYKPVDFGGWGNIFAELAFFREFPSGPRKNATFLTEAKKSPEDPVVNWQQFRRKHPHYKKWLDVEGFSYDYISKYIDWRSSRTMMIIRYAEVLLVYAEAKAMSDGPDASAYASINEVRNRAGLPDLNPGLAATAFRDSVINERKWEFAGNEPNSRWFDMVRTETVEAATMKRDPQEFPLQNQPDKSFYFTPIPQEEKSLNPNLK